MTDEEIKAIKMCNLLLNGEITLHILDNDGGTAYAGTVNKTYNNDLQTVLNLIQKQKEELKKKDRQLEEKTNRIINLEKECQKHFDNMMDTIQENSKKDKVIDLIVEMLRYYNGMHQEQCFCIDICENIECDEDNCYNRIKEYFYKKVEGK